MSEKCDHILSFEAWDAELEADLVSFSQSNGKNGKVRLENFYTCKYCPECGKKLNE